MEPLPSLSEPPLKSDNYTAEDLGLCSTGNAKEGELEEVHGVWTQQLLFAQRCRDVMAALLWAFKKDTIKIRD